ncbi:MAG: ATP-binding protein [Thermoanaerobaculia bacterium]
MSNPLLSLQRWLGRLFPSGAEQADLVIGDLQSQRTRLEAVVTSMREGVLVTDNKGLIRLVNPAFCRMFGITGEVEGASALELTHQAELEDLIVATLRSRQEQTAEIDIDRPVVRRLELSTSLLSDSLGAVVVARDITEVTRLTRMRRDFVANVSHELKTPLSAIRGYAETLRDGALEDPQASTRFLDRILQQCRRLQALLEDLLVLSRLESLEGQVERQPVELSALVGECVELMTPQIADKGVDLSIEERPVGSLLGDREALERLVANLVDNGLKYNRDGGGLVIRLFTVADTAVLEVEDSGIGIPADSLTRVFERFYRVDKGRSRSEGGTGLGLAIVKHVAQLHGGRVEVESHLGQGSVFRVHLPLGS